MRKLMIAPLLAAIALGGCGGPSGNNAAAENVVMPAEPENAVASDEAATGNALATVLGLNDAQRNGVFKRALDDAGIACDGVGSSERLPDQDGKPMWRANCRGINATSHMITITPDGTAQIVSRADR
jgi:hypothetical protein